MKDKIYLNILTSSAISNQQSAIKLKFGRLVSRIFVGLLLMGFSMMPNEIQAQDGGCEDFIEYEVGDDCLVNFGVNPNYNLVGIILIKVLPSPPTPGSELTLTPGSPNATIDLIPGGYLITVEILDQNGNPSGIECSQEIIIDDVECLTEQCSPQPPIDLQPCPVVQSTDGCTMEVFEYYFENELNQNLTNFDVKFLKIKAIITGDATFDELETQVIANLTTPPVIVYYPDGKTVEFILSCSEPLTHEIPLGDCDNPFMQLVINSFPGETISISTKVDAVFPFEICEVSNICRFVDKSITITTSQNIPFNCPNLSANFLYTPPSPSEPDDPGLIELVVYNTDNQDIIIPQIDILFEFIDVFNNLNGPQFITPLTGISVNGSEYMVSLAGVSLSANDPNGETILSFFVDPPNGLDNLEGQADVSLKYVRATTLNGCCGIPLNTTNEYSILFPGIQNCELAQVSGNNVTIFLNNSPGNVVIGNCEMAIAAEFMVVPLGLTDVRELFLELEFETSGTMQITEALFVDALGEPKCPSQIGSFNTCPPSGGINCTAIGSNKIQLKYCSFGQTLNTGDQLLILFEGISGGLESLEISQAYIRTGSMTSPCIPNTGPPAFSFPISTGCDFCTSSGTELNTNTISDPTLLDNCDLGFSVELNGLTALQEVNNISVRILLNEEGDTDFHIEDVVVNPALCPSQNTCNGSDCIIYNGNIIIYELCLEDEDAITLAPLNTLFDVVVDSDGCMDGISVIEAEIGFVDGSVCSPIDATANPLLENFCPGCDDKTILGTVIMEDGHPIDNIFFDVEGFSTLIPTTPENPDCNPSGNSLCNSSFNNGIDCTDGGYSHSFVCSNGANQVVVTPFKDDCLRNGVSTTDLIEIRKHILGTELIDSPYGLIAADVNNSMTITTTDLVELRKVILFIENDFPNNTSWRFVPADYIFPIPTAPWGFPECGNANFSLLEEQTVDFVAIKIGDINNSAECLDCNGSPNFGEDNSIYLSERKDHQINLSFVGNVSLNKGESTQIDFEISNFKDLVAFQMGLAINPAFLEIEAIYSGEIANQSIENNFGLTELKDGRIRTLWHSSNGNPVHWEKEKLVFSIKVKAKESILDLSNLITLDNQILRNLAFDSAGNQFPISLNFDGRNIENANGYQVTTLPNPFNNQTIFSIQSPKIEKGTITIFNLIGQEIAQKEIDLNEGWNEVEFLNTQFWEKGVLTYLIETSETTLGGKIIHQ